MAIQTSMVISNLASNQSQVDLIKQTWNRVRLPISRHMMQARKLYISVGKETLPIHSVSIILIPLRET